MNMQHSLIRELTLYEFELGRNVIEATINICVKCEGTVDHITVTRWFKKFYKGYKNCNNQAKPDRPKTLDSKTMPQAKEANPHSPVWFVPFATLAKASRAVKLCLILLKYCITFDSP